MSIDKQCLSIASIEEPSIRCPHKRKMNSEFCPIHSLDKNVIKFVEPNEDDVEYVCSTNMLVKMIDVTQNFTKTNKSNVASTSNDIILSTPQKAFDDKEDAEGDLNVKIVIMLNQEGYKDELPLLIGPVFKDVTLSYDEYDPITFDTFWTLENGKKIPSQSINRYLLFSYYDKASRLRCLSIFTIHDMFSRDDYTHPVTEEVMSDTDVNRARRLLEIYDKRLQLFKLDEKTLSEETIKAKTLKLFKRFNQISIYLDDKYFTNINNLLFLEKIAATTSNLVKNNIHHITSNPNSLLNICNFSIKNKYMSYTNETEKKNRILMYKDQILNDWTKIISVADNPDNQIPYWIITLGLASVVPEIRQKYPDIEIIN